MSKLLAVQNLCLAYGGRPTVKNVSLSLEAGEIRCLVGATGSGKSTVLAAVAGTLGAGARIMAGSIKLAGRELLGLPDKDRRHILGREITLIFQNPENFFDPIMRLGDQFTEFLRYHSPDMPLSAARHLAAESLGAMRLENPERLLALYPFELSGGMLQRCAIALSMLANPKLLLADEPTSALDIVTQKKILAELKKLNAETGTAILMVTHSMKVAAAIADTISVMHDGCLIESGCARDILTAPRAQYTKELLAALPRLEEMRLVD